jgi:hypothetical protein
MLERCLKLATTITVTVARYYDENEELGMAYFLSVFTGDAASLARTALADTPLSDHANFRLHGALLVLLRAYLAPRAGKELRLACDQFVFPANFARGWTELVRLYDLQCAIAELTVADAHYVKRLDPPSWGRFLQIMEDTVDDSPFADLDRVGTLFNCCPECHHAGGYEVAPNCKRPRGGCDCGGHAQLDSSRPVELSQLWDAGTLCEGLSLATGAAGCGP